MDDIEQLASAVQDRRLRHLIRRQHKPYPVIGFILVIGIAFAVGIAITVVCLQNDQHIPAVTIPYAPVAPVVPITDEATVETTKPKPVKHPTTRNVPEFFGIPGIPLKQDKVK